MKRNKADNYFDVKNLGDISLYLGIQVNRNFGGEIEIHHERKINELVKSFELENSKSVLIPMRPEYLKIPDDENLLPNNTKYQSLVGSLLYISNTTRPDICAAVNFICRRTNSPRKSDWEAAKQILKYLKSTINLKMKFLKGDNKVLECYVDADWAGEIRGRKSTSGCLITLGKNPVYWHCRKQTCVASSTTEAEFIAAAVACKEFLWIIRLLEDCGIEVIKPVLVYEDNQSCIKLISNDKYSARTKHIDVKYNIIKDLKSKGVCEIVYCKTEEMAADIFTKPLAKPRFEFLKTFLNIV